MLGSQALPDLYRVPQGLLCCTVLCLGGRFAL
jgi:hypothetical protein